MVKTNYYVINGHVYEQKYYFINNHVYEQKGNEWIEVYLGKKNIKNLFLV